MRTVLKLVGIGLGLVTLLARDLPAQSPAEGAAPSPPVAALDVPFLPQSELLCGGAAMAMVERYWGRRGVYAADFAGLVRPELRGIWTTDLAAAAGSRGWKVRAFDGTPDVVQRYLADSVPVIALIEVAPERYHYVVLLAWSDSGVRYHDPAVAPSRTVALTTFLPQWQRASQWAMVVVPSSGTTRVPAPAAPATGAADSSRVAGSAGETAVPQDSLPCRPWLDQAVDAAQAGRLDDAADLLATAERSCPTEPLVLRELAALRFKQHRLAESVQLSDRYVARTPRDSQGWQLLAASRYLSGDRAGALRAWNRVGAPTVDLTRIDGIGHIRYRVLADAIGIPNRAVLTPNALALARRRLADIPAVNRSAIEYRPVGDGLVELHASASERVVLDPAWRLLGTNALRALTQREVKLSVGTPTGGGEVWTGSWRWEVAHPRVALRADLPWHAGVAGVVGIEGSWERFRFSRDSALGGVIDESRRASGVTFGGWIAPSVRPAIGLRYERWSGGREYLAPSAAVELRAADDRFVLTSSLDLGAALDAHPSYTRGRLRAVWSSSVGLRHGTWAARAGVDVASRNAPFGLWPVASGDIPSAIPLRGHARVQGDFLPGTTAGRRIVHGGLSADRPFYRTGPFTLAAGVFLDGADVFAPINGPERNRFYLDAGGGLRIGVLDGQLGVLRIDLGTGLIDRHTALTIGMHQRWPPFRENNR